jgi:hypothetical protein
LTGKAHLKIPQLKINIKKLKNEPIISYLLAVEDLLSEVGLCQLHHILALAWPGIAVAPTTRSTSRYTILYFVATSFF